MKNILKSTALVFTAFVAAISVATVSLGNTNILAQSCINGDGVNCQGGEGGGTPPAPGAPLVTISAAPTSVAYNGGTTVQWSSQNATSCTASGSWSGAKSTSGTQPFSGLTKTSTYTIACTGTGGSTSSSVTVSVQSQPTPPQSNVPCVTNTPWIVSLGCFVVATPIVPVVLAVVAVAAVVTTAISVVSTVLLGPNNANTKTLNNATNGLIKSASQFLNFWGSSGVTGIQGLGAAVVSTVTSIGNGIRSILRR